MIYSRFWVVRPSSPDFSYLEWLFLFFSLFLPANIITRVKIVKSTSVVQIWFPLIKESEFCFVNAISVKQIAFWMQLKIKKLKSCFHKIAAVIRNSALFGRCGTPRWWTPQSDRNNYKETRHCKILRRRNKTKLSTRYFITSIFFQSLNFEWAFVLLWFKFLN